MRCLNCSGNTKKEKTTYIGKTDQAVVVIKNIKSNKCSQCGEETFDEPEVVLIGQIVDKLRDIPIELAVVNANKWK